MIFVLVLVAGTASAAIISVVLRRAESLGMVQRVNERSSHAAPTPTGGGVGIVAGTIMGLAAVGAVIDTGSVGILIPAVVVAAVGLVDDRWPLPSMPRLIAQLMLVGVMVVQQQPQPSLLGDTFLPVLIIFVTLLGAWWINVFNFMDGIDGFAGTQASFMLAAALLLSVHSGIEPWTEPLGMLMISALAATIAFLGFNWPPAKIFMGDVGSTFLGFVLFAAALASIGAEWLSLWQWSILGAVFTVDVSVTLVRRLLDGRNVLKAHRSHAYQRASRSLGGHRPVTLILSLVNCGLILPAAWLAGQLPGYAWAISLGTHFLLGVVAILVGAGKQEGHPG